MTLDIDVSSSKIPGLHLNFQKVHKLQQGGTQQLIITLKTKKTSKAGETIYHLPIKVQNGGKYIIELRANINIPDLRLSDSMVDFGKVLVGTSKIITIRLINEKIISCSWQVENANKNVPAKKKKNVRFFINQTQGHLEPNQQTNFEIRFEPTSTENISEKYMFSFKDSNRKIELVCSGQGVIPDL